MFVQDVEVPVGYNLRPDGEGTETRRLCLLCYRYRCYNLRPDGEGTETRRGYGRGRRHPGGYNLRPDGEGTETDGLLVLLQCSPDAVTTYDPMVRVLKHVSDVVGVGYWEVVTTYDPMVRVLKRGYLARHVLVLIGYNLRPDGEGTET